MPELIKGDEPAGVELRGMRLFWNRMRRWFRMNVSRRFPRLVWIGDEIDVSVRFTQDTINQEDPLRGLGTGGFAEIESQLRHMGITFDRGQGCKGRDWEWDWSLRGPINIRFRGRAKNPEQRKEEAQPALKIV